MPTPDQAAPRGRAIARWNSPGDRWYDESRPGPRRFVATPGDIEMTRAATRRTDGSTIGLMARTTVWALTMMLPTVAGAQHHGGTPAHAAPPPAAPPAAAPSARGALPRIGYAAPEPERAEPAPRRHSYGRPIYVVPTIYYYGPEGYVLAGAPYLALSDRSVLVNFGNGYERVLRQCAPIPQPQIYDPTARDPYGRLPDPPGITALRAGARGEMLGMTPPPTSVACYRADQYGRPEIITTR
jgi:hypothetical protein